MNRSLWTENITETYCPPWPCPVCHKGTLALTLKSLQDKETVESKNARSHDEWDNEWVASVFTGWAHCTYPLCKQEFALSGTGGVEYTYDEDGPTGLQDIYYPKSCHPALDIFDFPSKCPDNVTREMRAAFALFWAYPQPCAGRIRVAVECLLNHLKVARKKRRADNTLHDLKLHQRIDEFAKREPLLGNQLMALKWLGNSGSHDSAVSSDDLLDAFEIMEHSLGEIITQPSKRVAQLAKGLTKKHA